MARGRLTICAVVLLGTAFIAVALASASQTTRPHNIKVLINGKRFAITSIVGGTDKYLPVKTGRMRVEARWAGNANGSGYYLVISTTEPQLHKYATCTAGTSCLVPQRVRISNGQEVTWTVTIIKRRGAQLVAGFKVCLVGRA